MENFDGLIGTIAVSGMRAGLDKDTTINLVVSLRQTSDGWGSLMLILVHSTNIKFQRRQKTLAG
jgi:hypothetical protein